MNINSINNLNFGVKLNSRMKSEISAEEAAVYENAIERSPLLSQLDDSYEILVQNEILQNEKNRLANVFVVKSVDGANLRATVGQVLYSTKQRVGKATVPDKETKSKFGTRKDGIAQIISATSDSQLQTDRLRHGFLTDALNKLNVRAAVSAYNAVDSDLALVEETH